MSNIKLCEQVQVFKFIPRRKYGQLDEKEERVICRGRKQSLKVEKKANFANLSKVSICFPQCSNCNGTFHISQSAFFFLLRISLKKKMLSTLNKHVGAVWIARKIMFYVLIAKRSMYLQRFMTLLTCWCIFLIQQRMKIYGSTSWIGYSIPLMQMGKW